jgi:hypothetical protein
MDKPERAAMNAAAGDLLAIQTSQTRLAWVKGLQRALTAMLIHNLSHDSQADANPNCR